MKRTVGRAVSVLLGGAALGVLAPQPIEAVPVFARKYETSCQTCHVAFPKLNPAGEAFRRNGYRFPSPEDEDARREEPIALGHDAHRRLFPDAVWPGSLPSVPPLAFRLSSEMVVDPDRETPFSFDGLGGAVGITATTTLGSTFSAWFGARIVADADRADLELERAFVVVLSNPFFSVTRDDGSFEIEGVPPGDYVLRVWAERREASPVPVRIRTDAPTRVEVRLLRK